MRTGTRDRRAPRRRRARAARAPMPRQRTKNTPSANSGVAAGGEHEPERERRPGTAISAARAARVSAPCRRAVSPASPVRLGLASAGAADRERAAPAGSSADDERDRVAGVDEAVRGERDRHVAGRSPGRARPCRRRVADLGVAEVLAVAARAAAAVVALGEDEPGGRVELEPDALAAAAGRGAGRDDAARARRRRVVRAPSAGAAGRARRVPGQRRDRVSPAGSSNGVAAGDAQRPAGVEVGDRRPGTRRPTRCRRPSRERDAVAAERAGARHLDASARPSRGSRRSRPRGAAAPRPGVPGGNAARRISSRNGARCSGAGAGRRRRAPTSSGGERRRRRSRTSVGRRTPGDGVERQRRTRRRARSPLEPRRAPVLPGADPRRAACRRRRSRRGTRAAPRSAPTSRTRPSTPTSASIAESGASGATVAQPSTVHVARRGRREHALEPALGVAAVAHERGARTAAPRVAAERVVAGRALEEVGEAGRSSRCPRARARRAPAAAAPRSPCTPGIRSSRMPAGSPAARLAARTTIRTCSVARRAGRAGAGSSRGATAKRRPGDLDRGHLRARGRRTGSRSTYGTSRGASKRDLEPCAVGASARGRPASASPGRRRAPRTAGSRGTAGSRARTARVTPAIPS